MNEERSLTAYEYYKEAQHKFEYFFTGLTGVLIAFISNQYIPHKISISPYTLELFSLIVLIISFFIGLKRIEMIVTMYRLNHKWLHNLELKGALKSMGEGKTLLNKLTGEVITHDSVGKTIKKLDVDVPKLRQKLNEIRNKSKTVHEWRKWLFIIGLILLIGSRVWTAYYI